MYVIPAAIVGVFLIAAFLLTYVFLFDRMERFLDSHSIRLKRQAKDLERRISLLGKDAKQRPTGLKEPRERGAPPDPDRPRSNLVRILSIDGGGIRGILPAQVLVELERCLRHEDNNPNARLADYFDLIAGTSTGGILSCLYLCPSDHDIHRAKYSAEDVVDLYVTLGRSIFSRTMWQRMKSSVAGPKYAEDPFEDTLYDYLGDLQLSQLLKPCLITAYDVERRQPYFFTQHVALENPEKNFLVRDVARSTTAAPSYFRPPLIWPMYGQPSAMVDGCVFANNPAMCGYAEARTMDFTGHCHTPTARDMLIVSLGTGAVEKPYFYRKARYWGRFRWIVPMIDVLMTANSDTVHYQLCKMFDAVGAPGQYVRIEPELGNASPEMDDAGPRNVSRLFEAGEQCAMRYSNTLTELAKQLIRNQ